MLLFITVNSFIRSLVIDIKVVSMLHDGLGGSSRGKGTFVESVAEIWMLTGAGNFRREWLFCLTEIEILGETRRCFRFRVSECYWLRSSTMISIWFDDGKGWRLYLSVFLEAIWEFRYYQARVRRFTNTIRDQSDGGILIEAVSVDTIIVCWNCSM